MAERLWLGLELGTQQAKALAVTAGGTVAGSGAEPLTSWREGGRHEQDPARWWEALAAATRAALDGIDTGAVGGLALCATSGTIALVDAASGVPRTAGLMYDDTRAAQDARLAESAGADTWAALGYYRMQPSWALPRLLWLLRECPELVKGARLAHQPDVITRRLVGAPVPSDTSHALKTGYDLLGGTWPVEVFDDLGVPAGLLPDVVRPGSPLGTVCAEAAEATGIPAGTPVVAGMTDGCGAQLSAGALAPGSWNSVLGTTLVLKGASERLVRDPAGLVYCHLSPDGGWLPGAASSAGAGAIALRFGQRDLDELGRQAAGRPPGAVTYPLSGRGERFPFSAPDAEAFTIGALADEADEYAALLLGVAFVERLCFDYLDLLGAAVGGRLCLTGGGARNLDWCQLRADVLGRPVVRPERAEAAMGMAALAAASVTGQPVAATAAAMVHVHDVLDPRPERARPLIEPYLGMVDHLVASGWLPDELADHAHDRAR